MARFLHSLFVGLAGSASLCWAGGPALGQQRVDLSGLSDPEFNALVAAERTRRLSEACLTLERLTGTRPAECGSSVASGPSANTGDREEAAAGPGGQARPAAPSASTERADSGEQAKDEAANAAAEQGSQNQAADLQRDMATDNDNKQRFGGIEFGIGMAFSTDLGDNIRVREAQIVNGLVRVTRSDDTRARLILESHYFLTPPGRGLPFLGLVNPTREERAAGQQPMWGFGPFVAVQPGSDNVIDAIGGGLMFGLRRPTTGTDSFNVGLGFLYDLDVQTLGDGIIENEPLPAGETEIRYRRRAQSGFMIMSSFSF